MRAVVGRLAAATAALALAGCGSGRDAVSEGAPSPSPSLFVSASPTTTAIAAVGDPSDRVRIRMTVNDWHYIDGTFDDISSTGYEGGQISDAGKADLLDDVGNKQATRPDGKDWLPDAQVVGFVLSRAQWLWTARQLDEWAAVSDSVNDPKDAADGRRIAAFIRGRLAATGSGKRPSPGPAETRHYNADADDHELYLTPYDAPSSPYSEADASVDHVLTISRGRTADVLTLLTGRTYTRVDLTVRLLAAPTESLNSAVVDGWSVGEEATMSVAEPLIGIGSIDWHVPDVLVPGRPGLYRVRVLARDRKHDDADAYEEWPDPLHDPRGTERFDVTFWPVTAAAPPELLGSDAGRGLQIVPDGTSD